MKLSDIQECTVCGGNGSWCDFYGEPAFCEVCSKDNTGSCGCAICCSHCQGTGQEPVRVDKFLPRYRIGEELTIVCDACGGKGVAEQNRPRKGLFNPFIGACLVCNGKPKKTILIKEVEYKLIGSEHGVNVYYEVMR